MGIRREIKKILNHALVQASVLLPRGLKKRGSQTMDHGETQTDREIIILRHVQVQASVLVLDSHRFFCDF